jgi:HEPN domain-containing protein
MTSAHKAYVESWLDKAEHDLMSAQRLIEIEPVILDNACFHCQQAMEKCLKAYLIYNGFDVQKTHDIIDLLVDCAKYDSIFAAIDPLDINAYAVRGRYPDTNLMPTKEEAESYYQLALEIKSLTTERIIFS